MEKGPSRLGQDGSRIKFKESAEIKIYTPGASAAIELPIAVLNPPPVRSKDPDAYRIEF